MSKNGESKRGCLWWCIVIIFWPISLSVLLYKKLKVKKALKILILIGIWLPILILGAVLPDDNSETKNNKSNSDNVSIVVPGESEADNNSETDESETVSSEESSSESTVSSKLESSVPKTPSTQSKESVPAVVTQENPVQQSHDSQQIIVYITDTGSKYHTASCRTLKESKYEISLDEAKRNYGPCGICNPPQ